MTAAGGPGRQPAPAGAEPTRLWGGRFARGPAAELARLSHSIRFDWRLAPDDLTQSRAHARALRRAGVLDDAELARMLGALDELDRQVAAGEFVPAAGDEDVHTAIERGLLDRLGPLGGKLRAGRSRNDQVATDFRLYLRREVRALAAGIVELGRALVAQAERHAADAAPGFTHLQHAQPVSFGHELAKHVHALLRDVGRLRDWDVRAAVCPLGAAALATTSLALDPARTAADLGFAAPFGNSIDAVADRDFVAEFLFCAALLGVHLSRIGAEVCLWASTEFGWARLDDAYATGSSIMPQKKNPDVAEHVRGKAGRLIGHLAGLLATLKGLPFAYNGDLQEDKEPVFDAVDTLHAALPALAGLVATTRFRPEPMAAAAAAGFALATDVAEWLVRRGMPFRDAHEIAGECVRVCERRGLDLADLSDDDLTAISPHLSGQVRDVLTVAGSLAARSGPGGPGPAAVRAQLAALAERLAAGAAWAASPAGRTAGPAGPDRP